MVTVCLFVVEFIYVTFSCRFLIISLSLSLCRFTLR